MTKKTRGDHAIADEIAHSLSDRGTTTGARAEAMALLQRARDAGGGGLRLHYLSRAQQAIANLDPARQQGLIQRLQGEVLALQGRGGDTKIAHLTPGEIVIPKRLQTPEFMRGVAELARAYGIDPASLRIGDRRNAINPHTGQPEFDDEGEDDGSDDDAGFDGADSDNSGTTDTTSTDSSTQRPLASSQGGNACQLVPAGGQFKTTSGVIPLFQPQMASKLTAAIQNLNGQGIVPTMTDGYRTQAMQDARRAAQAAGQSQNTVAKGISPHQAALAVDFGPNNNAPYNDAIHQAMLGAGLLHNVAGDPPHYYTPDALRNQTPVVAAACEATYRALNPGGDPWGESKSLFPASL